MPIKRMGFQMWVYVAYGFYLLVGLAWLLVGIMGAGRLNVYALSIVIMFAMQFYFKHLVTNLVLGILFLFLSIFSLLEAINYAVSAAKVRPLAAIDRVLVAAPVVGIVMAGVLVFSYIKLSFKD